MIKFKYIENDITQFVEVEMIGRSQNNEFRGQKKLQIIIDYIRVNKTDASALL